MTQPKSTLTHTNRHISTPVDALVRRTFSATQVTSIEPSAVIAIGPDVYNGVIVRDFLKLKKICQKYTEA